MKVLVTGSSGYVAQDAIPLLKQKFQILGVDKIRSSNTNLIINIADIQITDIYDLDESYILVNLAAVRFDHDVPPDDYYINNVVCTKKFLSGLDSLPPKRFVHISSVASFDGKLIKFNDKLSCDDAYRCTKYMQSQIIREWCKVRGVELIELIPSAIYSDNIRDDTNIGNLQKIIKYLLFFPSINVRKSTTNLHNFSEIISQSINSIKPNYYLCIDNPIMTVTEIMIRNSKSNRPIIYVPFLKIFLKIISYICLSINRISGLNLMLYPSRVDKLFRDTSYDWVDDVNRVCFNKIK